MTDIPAKPVMSRCHVHLLDTSDLSCKGSDAYLYMTDGL